MFVLGKEDIKLVRKNRGRGARENRQKGKSLPKLAEQQDGKGSLLL